MIFVPQLVRRSTLCQSNWQLSFFILLGSGANSMHHCGLLLEIPFWTFFIIIIIIIIITTTTNNNNNNNNYVYVFQCFIVGM